MPIFDKLKLATTPVEPKLDRCKCSECGRKMDVSDCIQDHGHHNGWEMPPYTEILCPYCEDGGCVDDFWYSTAELLQTTGPKVSMLKPTNDTLITMARLVFEQSELRFLNVSFCIDEDDLVSPNILVNIHDDEKGTKELYETVSVSELVASYIGLGLTLDLDANDAVTTGHRLGNTGR